MYLPTRNYVGIVALDSLGVNLHQPSPLHSAGIRDMDYHFQTLKEMSQRITLRLDRAARAMDEVNKANVSPLASGSRSDRDSD